MNRWRRGIWGIYSRGIFPFFRSLFLVGSLNFQVEVHMMYIDLLACGSHAQTCLFGLNCLPTYPHTHSTQYHITSEVHRCGVTYNLLDVYQPTQPSVPRMRRQDEERKTSSMYGISPYLRPRHHAIPYHPHPPLYPPNPPYPLYYTYHTHYIISYHTIQAKS